MENERQKNPAIDIALTPDAINRDSNVEFAYDDIQPRVGLDQPRGAVDYGAAVRDVFEQISDRFMHTESGRELIDEIQAYIQNSTNKNVAEHYAASLRSVRVLERLDSIQLHAALRACENVAIALAEQHSLAHNAAGEYYKYFLNYIKRESAGLGTLFEGAPLIDIGSGRLQDTGLVDTALAFGASRVVRVDIDDTYTRAKSTPEVEIRHSDGLAYLRNLPDDSANVALFAIDGIIVPFSLYHELLAFEIARVVKPGGIVLGGQSPAIGDPIIQKHFIPLNPEVTSRRSMVPQEPVGAFIKPASWNEIQKDVLASMQERIDRLL